MMAGMGTLRYFERMSWEGLMAFWARYREDMVTRKEAEALVGRRAGACQVSGKLANLASNVAARKLCRELGDGMGEGIYRVICDQIVAELPWDLSLG